MHAGERILIVVADLEVNGLPDTACIRRNQVAAFAAMSGHGAERVAGLK